MEHLKNNRQQLISTTDSQTWKDKAIEIFIRRSWWLFLFLAICYLLYSHSMQKKHQTYTELKKRLDELEIEKHKILQEREDLLLQINSQSDPAWIQMTLMKGLGVVPDGQLKVYFKKEDALSEPKTFHKG